MNRFQQVTCVLGWGMGMVRGPGGCCGDGIAGFGGTDVFLFDRKAGTTTRVSLGSDGRELGGDAFYGTISADGSSVLFVSDASDVVPDQRALVVNRPPDETLPVPVAFLRDVKIGLLRQLEVPPDTVWIGEPAFTPRGTIVFSAGVSHFHEGQLDSWDYYEYDQSTGALAPLSPSSASSQFCPRAMGTTSSAWCTDVTGPSGVMWQVKGKRFERIAPTVVPGLNAPHESNAHPSLSAQGDVLAFVIDGRSATSGSNTSVIYLVAR